jgi:hypothetical protein
MMIYTLKIVLRGISPMIWRRLRVPGSTSLAQLHYVIQTIYGWDDDNLHQFHIYGKDYGINYDGGLGYSDNAHKVYLDDFAFDAGDKFSYEYNFFEHWMHDIRVEKIEKSIEHIEFVYCTKGSGMPGRSILKFSPTLFMFTKTENKGLYDHSIQNVIWHCCHTQYTSVSLRL